MVGGQFGDGQWGVAARAGAPDAYAVHEGSAPGAVLVSECPVTQLSYSWTVTGRRGALAGRGVPAVGVGWRRLEAATRHPGEHQVWRSTGLKAAPQWPQVVTVSLPDGATLTPRRFGCEGGWCRCCGVLRLCARPRGSWSAGSRRGSQPDGWTRREAPGQGSRPWPAARRRRPGRPGRCWWHKTPTGSRRPRGDGCGRWDHHSFQWIVRSRDLRGPGLKSVPSV